MTTNYSQSRDSVINGALRVLGVIGAAGGASSLPATPLGYLIAYVGSTPVKIPYYNN